MKKISHYFDVCTINVYMYNSYGDKYLAASSEVPCLFNWSFTQSDNNYVDNESTNATAYLDIDNEFVQQWKYRLEGEYFIFTRHGNTMWFKIRSVELGNPILTTNEENNCFLRLEKSVPQEG